uniref:Uncharacterized protein n=1 Tax=Opuntia streptacantha TaxID=393608 RepID=A0A7C8ZI09_OPUST
MVNSSAQFLVPLIFRIIQQYVLRLGRTYFKRQLSINSCGSATKADKGSAPAGRSILPRSQLEITVCFLIHQLVLIPRCNSHVLLITCPTQKQKGQALAIPGC